MRPAPLDTLLRRSDTFTTTQALRAGLSPRILYRLRDTGELLEISRGVFRSTHAPPTAHLSLLAVSRRVPKGIVCLTSALTYWDLTDELPNLVHIAVPRGVRPPQIKYPHTRVHVFARETFALGRCKASVSECEAVPVYSAARTIVDMMRLRNQVGRDLTFAALRRYLVTSEANPGQLMRFARRLRIETPMAAALEMLLP